MQVGVIIAAGGSSTRFGERNKLAEELGGRAVLQRSVELFAKRAEFGPIVVAGPADEGAMAEFKVRFGDALGLLGARVVPGGTSERYESVQAAMKALVEAEGGDSITHVAVHDGARPVTPNEVLDRVLEAAEQFPAVIPAIPVTDTLKRVGEEEVEGEVDPLDAILGDAGKANQGGDYRTVGSTVEREGLVAVQTPQVFEADVLRRAYAQSDLTSTDDAGLVERLGERVVLVDGDPRNVKITTPLDLLVARAVLDERGEAAKRARNALI
ncbi:MAG: 2-C-methyl-D-erythritol 4-phosphate cytidylyltransferase [Planctomycetota bacterium]